MNSKLKRSYVKCLKLNIVIKLRFYLIFLSLIVSLGFKSNAQKNIFSDNFNNGTTNWKIESESDSVTISIENQELEIIAPKGFTLWLNKPLENDLEISFDALVVKGNGKYDRVSDLNCFWMASDPENPDNFFARSKWRNGTFGKYYSLKLYYVGYGGNSNTTTRFRKYDGNYESFKNKTMRPDIIKEYNDSAHLIHPNQWNHIEIIMNGNNIKYLFNQEILFDYNDSAPYMKGYFGFRTVTNHMKVRNFRVMNH